MSKLMVLQKNLEVVVKRLCVTRGTFRKGAAAGNPEVAPRRRKIAAKRRRRTEV
jgi:hypothetical protein